MKESIELRLGNLAAYGAACLLFMAIFYGFTLIHTVIALITAMLLSIQSEERDQRRVYGLIIGSAIGIFTLFTGILGWSHTKVFIYIIAGIASASYILSHWGKEKLQPISTLFYFIVAFAFTSSFGADIGKYAELIFFTLAFSMSIPLMVVRMNRKIRIHRRVHSRKSSH